MGSKKKKQPGDTPAKKANQNTVPELCIRCPDRETAEKKEHRNDLNKCFNDFPSRQIGDEPETHTIDQLWWGFMNEKVSADLDLSKPAVCDELLEYAKTVGKNFQPHLMDSEIEERNKSDGLMAAKRDAKWKLPHEGKVIPLSKETLEAALEAVQSETSKKTTQTEKWKAEKAMRKAGTSVLGQDATAAGLSSKVSADAKGSSSGTGSAVTNSKTASSGGGSGSGEPLRGGPPTSGGTIIHPGSAQQLCPRCPVNSPHHHAHAIAPDGLLDCYGQIQPGIGSTLASNINKLWPRLRLDRDGLGPDQLSSYDAVNDRLHSDPDLDVAKAIVQVLRQSGTQYMNVPLTKGLAEYALLLCHQAQREPATLDESNPEDGVPSTGPSSAPNLTVSIYSNPTHTNELTGVLDQHTDHDRTLGYTRDVAIRMLRNAGRDLDKLSKAELEQEIGEVSKSFGLRTSFASKARDHSKVSTNHLGMRWPTEIHVYAVEMIRTNRSSTAPVTVKKNADKRMVIEMLKSTHYAQYLNNSGGTDRALKWVTDGDLIWSVVPLFHANDPTIVPDPLHHGGGGVQITYENEMGVRLTLEEITITFNRTINLARSMGEMFYDTTTATYDDSDPGLITRGLNAFFSRFATETPGNVSTSANKSFVAMTQRVSLDTNPAQRTMAALKGFFLSVRPGIDSMYLNVNHATSPFFEEILVSEFVTRARQAGRSEGEIRAVLKGVKVRIIYQTVTPFKKEDERYRFITCVGSSVRMGDGTMQLRPDIGSVTCSTSVPATSGMRTVYDWYTAPLNSQPRSHEEFPAPPLRNLPQSDWAVNVGCQISKPDSVRWYPASQLRIAPQQLFRGRLTGSQTTQMLNVAVQTPDPHRTSILRQAPNNGMFHLGYAGNSDVRAANPAGGNQSLTEPSRPAGPLHQAFLQAVNMQAEIEMIRIPGKWLSRPTLVYSPRGKSRTLLPSNKPGTASWDLRDRVFATQADFRELAVLDLQARSLQSETRRGFIELLCTQLQAHGLIPPRQVREVRVEWQSAPLTSNTMDLTTETKLRAQLKSLLDKLHQPYPPILVFLDYSLDTYACVKRVADLDLGIQTICAASGKAVLRWSPQTVSNIVLKFNVKGAKGGCDNHHFDKESVQMLRSASQ
ncbi:ATP-dependent RNA helicase dbp4 [Friedmanniomyces endolithicus]|nr:ATP-dependent RNA helicase dbp4 [Friedmanniomyces endolithicus]